MHSSRTTSRRFVRLLALVLGGYVVAALVRSERPSVRTTPEDAVAPESPAPVALASRPRRRSLPVRLAFAGTFVMLFFAGAALTAGAGDQVAQLVQGDPAAATTTDATTDATTDVAPATTEDTTVPTTDVAPTTDNTPTEPVDTTSVETSPDPAVTEPTVDAAPADASTTEATPAPDDTLQARVPVHSALPSTPPVALRSAPAPSKAKRAARKLVVRRAASAPVVDAPGTGSVVWLNRPLGDPTPEAARLTRPFARDLWQAAKAAGTDWALVLGVLRAQGAQGRVPADPATVRLIAGRLGELQTAGKTEAEAVAELVGDQSEADRAVALAHYDRAIGVETLIQGLDGAKGRLVRWTLLDPRITIYPAGRGDLEHNRVNVRVVAVMRYLADTFGSVEVTCLVSGHPLYARPRVISAHIFGEAVDVAALGGVSVYGHQEVGGLTEQAVEDLLLLPAELQPKQVISLLNLGGPSFALADHYDHIHVGF